MRKHPYAQARIRIPLANRLRRLGRSVGFNLTQMVEGAIEDYVDIAEAAPDRRFMPRLLAILDAVRDAKKHPRPVFPASPRPTRPSAPPPARSAEGAPRPR